MGQISAEQGAELWEACGVHAQDGLWGVILISAGPATDKADPWLSSLAIMVAGVTLRELWREAMVVRVSIRLWAKRSFSSSQSSAQNTIDKVYEASAGGMAFAFLRVTPFLSQDCPSA